MQKKAFNGIRVDAITGMFAMLLVLVLIASHVRAGGEILPSTQGLPRNTSVLLLPALDVTAESANMLSPRQAVVHHRQQYEFISRQFKVLGEAMAKSAAKTDATSVLDDVSARTPANLDALAKRTAADWVVSVVVENAGLEDSLESGFVVRTRVRLQIWDARNRTWLADRTYVGEAVGDGSPIFTFKNSLDRAVKDSLEAILTAYPKVVPVTGERGMKDYLAGQTQPFVGDPGKPFSGVKTDK